MAPIVEVIALVGWIDLSSGNFQKPGNGQANPLTLL